MSHTPGPWNWSETDEGHEIRLGPTGESSCEVQRIIEYDHGLFLEDELSEEDDPQNLQFLEAQANARLIAAAPDLLAACQDQIAWIERLLQTIEYRQTGGSTFGEPINGFSFSPVPEWDLRQKLESLREDIAKATGANS